jgi:hypothetical protein
VSQPLALPRGVSASAIGTPLQSAAEPELVVLGLGAALLFGILVLQARRRLWVRA